MPRFLLFSLLIAVSLTGCYTLSGISIPTGVEKAYVPLYIDNALGAPPTLYIDMTEALRDKIRDQARLQITEDAPDIEVKGTLVDFRVSAEGASPSDETAAFAKLNRLTIVVAIEYKNLRDESDEGWKQNFSNYYDFPATQTLASIQDEAIEDITDQINEAIFNKAFAEDW
ncbi:hypothetical protein FUA23_04480 [Neolewinella aurantiaca]|uniref:Lipopolysaccharide assembly protein n=1 Tax=Neolewinella aurantiaca TaxID=2602767 RepID=A0A5C7FWD0_9BACT|nr:LPS assembly lipoprotein LptE [Neolewinella aurantiaca]TXF90702.1 hypothetical protein FUA23_04480 [Neolewinella aurantiaca]